MKPLAFALLAAATLATTAAPAHADPGEKDPRIATGLSIAGAAAGAGVLALGIERHDLLSKLAGAGALIAAPSAGAWYAGKSDGLPMVTRAVGVLFLTYGATTNYVCVPDDPNCRDHTAGNVIMGIGAAAIFSGTIWSVVDAPRAADDWNARHHVSVSPTYEHGGGGVALAGTF